MAVFKTLDRVIHNTNFPILPMTVLDSDAFQTECKLEYNKNFVSTVTFFTSEVRLFPIQRPDFGFYFVFDKSVALPKIQIPYISQDFDTSVSFYLDFLKDWSSQCKRKGGSTDFIRDAVFRLSQADCSIDQKDLIRQTIVDKTSSSMFCDSYSFIEYSGVESKEYFDYSGTRQDEFDIIALTVVANLIFSGCGIPFEDLCDHTEGIL